MGGTFLTSGQMKGTYGVKVMQGDTFFDKTSFATNADNIVFDAARSLWRLNFSAAVGDLLCVLVLQCNRLVSSSFN